MGRRQGAGSNVEDELLGSAARDVLSVRQGNVDVVAIFRGGHICDLSLTRNWDVHTGRTDPQRTRGDVHQDFAPPAVLCVSCGSCSMCRQPLSVGTSTSHCSRFPLQLVFMERHCRELAQRVLFQLQKVMPLSLGAHAMDVADGGGGQVVDGPSFNRDVTIEWVFQQIQRAIDTPASQIVVTFSPELGYPTEVYIDWYAMMADDEAHYFIKSVHPYQGWGTKATVVAVSVGVASVLLL
eukprot:CAMPEP_0175805986 /NCGR_PEP_ID=MMETSP0107_2-20121207/948_1 /TAXON_ID=195067 ORGANISM="Goniomonas pacifica, Strain CCMP1869" /NCGR_SAMPLE_ID=MMETSP0107_2 /ASSEMBLY_ACC=CAM_ASM_000203 /LENGTH=237 /DNA_ID=CAMNT_0017117443 /DNA_START=1334 /DNA_END=2045 /DNA_ORIENTATION=+